MTKKSQPERMTIDELEKLLQREDEAPIEILPNGTVRRLKGKRGQRKPLTLKQNLGGEYGDAA
jgi:hypothetical protein